MSRDNYTWQSQAIYKERALDHGTNPRACQFSSSTNASSRASPRASPRASLRENHSEPGRFLARIRSGSRQTTAGSRRCIRNRFCIRIPVLEPTHRNQKMRLKKKPWTSGKSTPGSNNQFQSQTDPSDPAKKKKKKSKRKEKKRRISVDSTHGSIVRNIHFQLVWRDANNQSISHRDKLPGNLKRNERWMMMILLCGSGGGGGGVGEIPQVSRMARWCLVPPRPKIQSSGGLKRGFIYLFWIGADGTNKEEAEESNNETGWKEERMDKKKKVAENGEEYETGPNTTYLDRKNGNAVEQQLITNQRWTIAACRILCLHSLDPAVATLCQDRLNATAALGASW